MKLPVAHQTKSKLLPILSSSNQSWDNILVNQFQHPSGEATCHFNDEHAICLSLASRPVRMLHRKGGKTQVGLYGKRGYVRYPCQRATFRTMG
jgi:AraC family transcriptional regulator